MGYRIDYGVGKAQAGKSHKIWLWFVDLTLLFTAVICLWPEARTAAAKLLLSGSAEKIVLAAEAFAQELRGGTSVLEAVEVFCQGILAEVGYP